MPEVIKQVTTTFSNCLDCPYHKVVSDPDPWDSFCRDDEAVLCTKMEPILKESRFQFRPVTSSCRPYQVRKESNIPNWCPL